MNLQTIVGNVGADPVVRTSQNGNARTTFSVAITEGDKDKGTEKTHWVDVTAFGRLGENFAKSIKKGMRVILACRIDTYQQEVSINGETKSLTRVSFRAVNGGPDLTFQTAVVERAGGQGGGSYQAPAAQAAPAAAPAQQAAPAMAGAGQDEF